MIDFLFEKVSDLYFSWWSLWKYVPKHHIKSTGIAWNEFLMWHSIGWLKSENKGNGRGRPSWISTFRLVKMQNDFRNGFCVKHLIDKVVLQQFLGPFSFKVHFQYDHRWPSWIWMFGLVKIQEMIPGNKHILLKTRFSCEIQQVIWVIGLKTEKNEIGRWRPSWILIFRLIKIQKWCQKLALYTTFSRKSDITRVSMTIYFQVTFSIWPQAAILNFDGWTGQNTKMMPEMDSPCQN